MLSRTLTGEWNGTVALSDYFISLESTTDLDLKTGICNVCVCECVCVCLCSVNGSKYQDNYVDFSFILSMG